MLYQGRYKRRAVAREAETVAHRLPGTPLASNKKPRMLIAAGVRKAFSSEHKLTLDLYNIGRLRTFGATGNFEFNLLVHFQGLESLALNGGEVHENIFSVVLGNEAVAFGVIEPLYLTLSQTVTLLCCKISGQLDCPVVPSAALMLPHGR